MGGEVFLFLALLALLSGSSNNDIKEVYDRLPYVENQRIFPGSDGDGGYRIIIENTDNGYILNKTHTGTVFFKSFFRVKCLI